MKDLLEARKIQKKRKPKFTVQDSHKKKRVARLGWRRPKGSDSKMRLGIRGYRKAVSVGYKSPSAVRGLTKEGLKVVHIANLAELKSIDPKTDGVMIRAQVGMRKRIDILEEVIKQNLTLLNFKDAKVYLESLKAKVEEKKQLKAKKSKAKAEKDKKKEAAAKDKEKQEKAAEKGEDKKSLDEIAKDEEKKKKAEKKEKDKLLTQKA